MTETMENTLPDRLTVNVNGTEKEIFMSAGLLRRVVMQTLGTAGNDLTEMYLNPQGQNDLMCLLLVDRDKRGQYEKEAKIEDFEMSSDDGDRLIAWATEHALSFFVKSASRMKGDLSLPSTALSKLMFLQTGTQDLVTKNASAGDTEADTATSTLSSGVTRTGT